MHIHRRDFLKTSAAAVALPALGGCASAPVAAVASKSHAAGSDTIRIGLVGCGGRGTGACVQALRADPGCVLTAMGDVFADRLDSSYKSVTEAMGEHSTEKVQVSPDSRFVGWDACDRVLQSGVDVVLLTSYPHFRPRDLHAAIAAGKHVFAEKPVAVDAPGIRSVLASGEEARAKNLALMIGFCWRYHDGMRATFDQVNRGTLGDVLSVHTTYLANTLSPRPRQPGWTDMEFQMRNWWHFTWLSGDHIVEQAVHSVDRLCWALDDKLPTRVTCLGGRAARTGPESGNVYDHFAATYEYDDGRRCFHTCRQIDRCPADNTDYVHGTNGSAAINGWNAASFRLLNRRGRELWAYTGENRDMYQNEHDALFKSIRAGKPINDLPRAANSCLMAMMGRMAAYTGQTITWEQALNSQEDLAPPKYEFGEMPTPPVAVPGKTKFV